MKNRAFIALISSLVLFSCGRIYITPEPTALAGTETPIPAETGTTAATIAATVTATVSETPVPTREAIIAAIENDVLARDLPAQDFTAASIQQRLLPGGDVQTGTNGRVRIDLLPEGTIVRAGGTTLFTLGESELQDDQVQTTLELQDGKLFILLNSGLLEVRTPLGIASVRDGLLRVFYDPQEELLMASCLLGTCTLENQSNQKVTLNADDFSFIEDGQIPATPIRIYREEILEWRNEIPELAYFLPDLPDPQDYTPQHTSVPTPTKRPRSYP